MKLIKLNINIRHIKENSKDVVNELIKYSKLAIFDNTKIMWRIRNLKHRTRLDSLPAISLKDFTAFPARISTAMLTPDVNCKT
jgi:hypothetical protein